MPLTLIQGHYRIVHAAPDGDSIKFYPNNPDLWQGMGVRTNHAGGAQLRLDGIDALETHYQPKGGSLGMLHQPALFAQASSTELLTFLGFKKVVRGDREIVISAQPEQTPGFILTRFADTYGRSVAFAFKGSPGHPDGSAVTLDKVLLRASANYHLLAQGLAYPTYYSKLYPDLRQETLSPSRG
ncbi:MAG: hypothetical protein ACOY4D_05630 [Pseudomonadota bacterium]